MMMNGTVLRTRDLSIGYRRARKAPVVIASDLNFSLGPGELVCLLGPNGAGKSTLMRTLARLQPSLSGQIWLDERPLDDLRPGQLARRLSIVLTDRVDVGAMSGYGLVSLGRHPYTGWTGTLSVQDQQIVQWALHAVRAKDLSDRLTVEMSDGERQKVLIARALAQQPRVMLLDEPTAFLDLPRRVEVMDLLRQLASENSQAILLSTHDLDLALRNADRLWLLSADGELFDGAPEDLILNGAFERVFLRRRGDIRPRARILSYATGSLRAAAIGRRRRGGLLDAARTGANRVRGGARRRERGVFFLPVKPQSSAIGQRRRYRAQAGRRLYLYA